MRRARWPETLRPPASCVHQFLPSFRHYKLMPKSVLIVDDNPLVRRAVRGLFTFDGFVVCGEAGDGAQAIEKAKQTRPDVIVLDFSMPVMDGIRAAKALKQIMPDVPLILFTTHASSAWKKRPWPRGWPRLSRNRTHPASP